MFSLLVVDDDPSLMELYKAVFAKQDQFEVDFVMTPEECRSHMHQKAYDLVLLDLCLTPVGTDGLELLSEIRHTPRTTSVFMMSSQDDPNTVASCRQSGALNFISKNHFFLGNLLFNLEAWCLHEQAHRELRVS